MEPESSSPYPQVPATHPAAAIGDPAFYRLLTFQVPSNMSLFLLRLRDTSSRNTPLPRDPSVGVVYLRIVLSPEEASHLMGNS